MGGHVFLENMSFRYVLREGMLCRRKYFMGGHVLVECMFSGWCILYDDVFYWKICLTGGRLI